MEPSIQAEAGSIHGANDAPVEGHAREWWERYLVLLIPLLLVTFYVVYIWPSYGELWPLFITWMVLVTVVLWFISARVHKVLNLPEYRILHNTADGKPIVIPQRRLVGPMVWASALLVMFTALQGIVYTMSRSYDLTGIFMFVTLLAALVFTIIFVLLWPRLAPGLEQRFDTYFVFWMAVLVLAVVLVGAAFTDYALTSQVSGPPATWADLLRLTQHEAEKIDKGAMLEGVSARSPYSVDPPYSPQSTAFVVDFEFRKPDEVGIRVEVLDTDPPRLWSVNDKWDDPKYEHRPTLPPELLMEYAANLTYIKLSPRDAYRITEQEGLAFAQEVAPGQSPEVRMGMGLGYGGQKWFGVPAGWNVVYSVKIGDDDRSLFVRVDGASGQVVDREYWPENLRAAPTPSPTGGR